MFTKIRNLRKQQGFTLVECLIALFVLAIGVTGTMTIVFASLRTLPESQEKVTSISFIQRLIWRLIGNETISFSEINDGDVCEELGLETFEGGEGGTCTNPVGEGTGTGYIELATGMAQPTPVYLVYNLCNPDDRKTQISVPDETDVCNVGLGSNEVPVSMACDYDYDTTVGDGTELKLYMGFYTEENGKCKGLFAATSIFEDV